MAKGKKHLGRKHRAKNNANKVSKGQKRHLRNYGELHPADLGVEERKVVKRARRDFSSDKEPRKDSRFYGQATQQHESESSEGEGGSDPYVELLRAFGLNSGTYVSQLTKKWKEEESEEDEVGESGDEKEERSYKEQDQEEKEQLYGDATEKKTDEFQSENNNGKGDDDDDDDNDDDDNDDYDNDDDDDLDGADSDSHPVDERIVSDNEPETEDADDYRKKNAVDEESDDDNNGDEDVVIKNKARTLAGTKDPFADHFEQDLEESFEMQLRNRNTWKQRTYRLPSLGSVTEVTPSVDTPLFANDINEETSFLDLRVQGKLSKPWQAINSTPASQGLFTPLQQDIFYLMNSYKDVFYSNRTFQNGDEIRRLYCLHAVNHVLKTRSRVMKNSAKIFQSWKDKKDIGEQRDQGLTRPKVLILVPFRDAALKVIEVILQLICPAGEGQVMNKKRLYDEFSEKEEAGTSKDSRPEDFKQMFAGNSDDCFRLGIAVMKRSIKLYAKFYASDIIVASPLGLRTIIGSQGEKTYEYDFLSSIEVLIMDQTDVFLMQNWEHLQHIFEHLHLQPRDAHDVDFSRVRMWCLNGWSKYYRQTIIFSSFISPEINSLVNRNCHNYAGKVKASLADVPGSICQVAAQVPQAFRRIECSSFTEAADKRFDTFINKILPEFKGSLMGHTAIFVPSYFDFVRLRNYFKREAIECAQISEYSQQSDMRRARTYFQQGKRPFLLFTERFYFFYRYRIRGIKNIIFYELPHYSTFYPEVLNFMDANRSQSDARITPVTCTVLYTKFNTHRLAGVVGTQRCRHMMSSDKHIHMFVTGDEDT